MKLSRREFLTGLASIAVVGCSRKTDPPVMGVFVDDAARVGHALRDGLAQDTPNRSERTPVVIVGGGIAGLSAAWHLERRGFRDFLLLEMEDEVGGNSRWGQTEVSAHPWAAHYVPVPGPGATLVRELFEDLGVLRDGVWEETMLVFSPQQRLYRWGRWHEGLEEPLSETASDRAEFRRFGESIELHRESGEFTIPSIQGRPSSSPLDRVSMDRWMTDNGFASAALRWYVDYACRDDFGAAAGDTSAWAGIHYFAARPAEEEGPLTWPEGNGWVVQRLLERLGGHVRAGQPVHRVESRGTGARVLAGRTEYLCDSVIWTAPSFLAPFVVDGAPRMDLDYSPWLTANLTLEHSPAERGPDRAWENLLFDSPALGYVVADHQSLATQGERSVWTWYRALSDRTPSSARALLLERGWSDWRDIILADLERAHPDIRQCVSRIDIMRMGHAMIRPSPGFLSSGTLGALRDSNGPVFYGNSDLSGMSLFEEAQQRGVAAADGVLRRLGSA